MEVKQPDRVLNSWHFFLKLKLSKGFFNIPFQMLFFPPVLESFLFLKNRTME